MSKNHETYVIYLGQTTYDDGCGCDSAAMHLNVSP